MVTRLLVFLTSLTDEKNKYTATGIWTGPCWGCNKNPCACKR